MRRTNAIIFKQPNAIDISATALKPVEAGEVLIEVEASGISTGTERLLFSGEMPPFPGMGYPLVPGYEAVGRVVASEAETGPTIGTRVFVPGSHGFTDAHGLFGAQAGHLVARSDKLVPMPDGLGIETTLFALAATAHRAVMRGSALPDLIVGHGVLGRLAARIAAAKGKAPTVWEANPRRRSGARGYDIVDPLEDNRCDYAPILDVSGDSSIIDSLVARSAKGGEIVLAGFYKQPLAFTFPPAFMRETSIRIAAEWSRADMDAVVGMAASGTLSLSGLVTHTARPADAAEAYRTAFEDADCLKMIIEWERGA
ncbi:2-desacetyl-2-hydroxyethyl bacteriochlorophyllide [Fulvimarina pelagi HTCC2506]|uniref:2-desacetyl-2-hydroxyethyl bacteriochlorophyllide n=1 Tax=Fulvimarina pelagi HTCC2506 TaxID=314231 RepID=Q0FYT7_9HYPH|nr:chlorophyll synthesis pathway protein BchC [Fulvimarina pelagi]EAU40221.1 2-desacetyl-2-hydroxyethyl bacteriochlorophyllide [Fulvimarina pelagi HTCC2506]